MQYQHISLEGFLNQYLQEKYHGSPQQSATNKPRINSLAKKNQMEKDGI